MQRNEKLVPCAYLAFHLFLLVCQASQYASSTSLVCVDVAGITTECLDVVLALVCEPEVQPAQEAVCLATGSEGATVALNPSVKALYQRTDFDDQLG